MQHDTRFATNRVSTIADLRTKHRRDANNSYKEKQKGESERGTQGPPRQPRGWRAQHRTLKQG